MTSTQTSLQREMEDDLSANDQSGGPDSEARECGIFPKDTLFVWMLEEQQLPQGEAKDEGEKMYGKPRSGKKRVF